MSGWQCDEARNLCVRIEVDGGSDTGSLDTSMPTDTGTPTDTSTPTDTGIPTDTSTPTDTGTPTDTSPPPDTAPPPDPTACDDVHAGAIFCDGFESGDFSAWDRELTPSTSVPMIETGIVYRGASSLRAEALPGASSGSGVEAEVFPIVAGISEQWLRGYYYVPSSPGLGMEFNTMREASGGYDFTLLVDPDSTNVHNHSAMWRDSASDVFPVDRWVCVETHVRLNDATTGVVEAYWDGVRVLRATDLDTTAPRGLGEIMAGLSWKSNASTRLIYVDEVVADDSMIGCD